MKSCLLLLLLASATARAQVIPVSRATLAGFIPLGYQELDGGRATGDLNGDGRPDVVLVLKPAVEDTTPSDADESVPPRLVLVLWRTPAGYQLAAQSKLAILCKACGGAFGDPFAGLDITGGKLTIYHYGGSSWRWSITSKFRYQQGDLRLIGESISDGRINEECPKLDYPPSYTYRDTNFLTGSYEVIRVSDDCKLLAHKRGRQPVRPLQKLSAYQPAS